MRHFRGTNVLKFWLQMRHWILLLVLAISSADAAQIQIGTVDGAVRDPSHAAVAEAQVVLYDATWDFERLATTNDHGQFQLRNVPFGQYGVRIEADGFRPYETTIAVRSNLTLTLEVVLEIAGPREELTVRAAPPLVEPDHVSSTTRLDQGLMKRLPGARPGSGMQELVATAPGWATEDNGLLHSRGVDDGFLYVSDGIPLSDRIDTFFSSALDPDAFQTIEILDGHLPVEYGNASGGVINVVPKSGLGESWSGTAALRAGSLQSSEVAATGGGQLPQLNDRVGAFFALSYGGSGKRYLDPVDPGNFNNRGNAFRLATRLDWRPTPKDLVIADISANGSAFRVTNSLAQELAGQRQRQELRDDHQSVIWQRSASPEHRDRHRMVSPRLRRGAFRERERHADISEPGSPAHASRRARKRHACGRRRAGPQSGDPLSAHNTSRALFVFHHRRRRRRGCRRQHQ